jgi:hypothetical protein
MMQGLIPPTANLATIAYEGAANGIALLKNSLN